MNKGDVKRYQEIIKEKYSCELKETNYKENILKEFINKDNFKKYFLNYMNKNENQLNFNWGIEMFLFIKASEEKNVTEVEKYVKDLNKYPDNYFIEYVLSDIELMYYGKLFESRDRIFKAIKLKPNDADCYYNLGFIYNLLGCFEKSLEYFNKAIYYSDDSASSPKILKCDALFNIAVYYIRVEKDKEKGEQILKEILEFNKEYGKARNVLSSLKGEL